MLGFDAPLTIETEGVLDCPKALWAKLIPDNKIASEKITITEDGMEFVRVQVS